MPRWHSARLRGHLTPLPDGRTEIYCQQHSNVGRHIPVWLVNKLAVNIPFNSLTRFRQLLVKKQSFVCRPLFVDRQAAKKRATIEIHTRRSMLDYIKTWHKEHAKIQSDLVEVMQLDVFSRAGKMKLEELKRALELHLLSEDQNFYPTLKKAAETDPNLRRELFLFAADMNKITAEVLAFFRKEENDPLSREIPAEFSKMATMIKSRISREENILMKEFEKAAGQKIV